ncbi:hypothetical protein KIPB_010117, partial [Kipferlia bialata]|eukprot:g10117.t1
MEDIALDLGIHDDLLTSVSQISNAGYHVRTGPTGIRPSVSYSLDTSSLTGCVSLTFDTVVEDFVVFQYDATSTSAVVSECAVEEATQNVMDSITTSNYCGGSADATGLEPIGKSAWIVKCAHVARCGGAPYISEDDWYERCVGPIFTGPYPECEDGSAVKDTDNVLTEAAANYIISLRAKAATDDSSTVQPTVEPIILSNDVTDTRAKNYPPWPWAGYYSECSAASNAWATNSVDLGVNVLGVSATYNAAQDYSNTWGPSLWISDEDQPALFTLSEGTSTLGSSFYYAGSNDWEEDEMISNRFRIPPPGNNTVSETTYPLTDVDGTETLY